MCRHFRQSIMTLSGFMPADRAELTQSEKRQFHEYILL